MLFVIYQGLLLLTTFNFNLAWINYIQYNIWDNITYQLQNFNGATVEVWEWISNFTQHFNKYVITNPGLDWK